MLTMLLTGAQRVWTAIPAWIDVMRPWSPGREDLSFCWLPVPSTLRVSPPAEVIRQSRVLIGHFGTYQPAIQRTLADLLPMLLAEVPEARIELLGRGSEQLVEKLRVRLADQVFRVSASGELDAAALSQRLQACDLLVQPYPDGASTRRTTLMAALSHGIPVVTTTGRLTEGFWRDSDAIATVCAGDVEGMARLVAAVAHDPNRREAMAASARATYDARFDLRHTIHALRSGECATC
jgi:glycosyltransferase involved in cell wall biosynthesis